MILVMLLIQILMQCYLYIIYHSIRFIAYFKNFFTALRQYRGGQSHSLDVNHCVCNIRPDGHWEPRKTVGSLTPAEHLVGFEPGTF